MWWPIIQSIKQTIKDNAFFLDAKVMVGILEDPSVEDSLTVYIRRDHERNTTINTVIEEQTCIIFIDILTTKTGEEQNYADLYAAECALTKVLGIWDKEAGKTLEHHVGLKITDRIGDADCFDAFLFSRTVLQINCKAYTKNEEE